MNIATTVLKQPTQASVRAANGSAKRPELASVHGHRVDKFNGATSSAAGHPVAAIKSVLSARPSVNGPARAAGTPPAILMESNAIANAANKRNNSQRRHTFCIRDEELLKMLSAPPDEPLYIGDNVNDHHRVYGDKESSFGGVGAQRATNLLLQYDEARATSPIVTRVAVDDNENLPPSDKCVLANNEDNGCRQPDEGKGTPQRYFSSTVWGKIQHDLNSPSASCRVRAMDAIKNPTSKHFYSYLDETAESEQSRIIDSQPKSFKDVMKDVIVYVEVRSVADNRTTGVKSVIAKHGIKVNDRLLRNTTHIVFKDGLQSTYNKAKSWNIPIVSILWFEACRKHSVVMDPKAYSISNLEKYENPDLYEKAKRQKCIQPDTLMQNLHKKIPKSKLLEQLKRQDDCLSLPSSPTSRTPDAAKKPPAVRSVSTPRLPKPSTAARRSLAKPANEPPKNTIRAMFQKQLEKSLQEQSQSSVDDSGDETRTSPTTLRTIDTISSKVEQIAISSAGESTTLMLAPGSAHKRLTRRNSMTVQTPTKADPQPSEPAALQQSRRKRRCTLFAPSFIDAIAEDDTAASKAAAASPGNATILQSQPMDVCEKSAHVAESAKCNNRTRQLLNAELLQSTSTPATKKQLSFAVDSPSDTSSTKANRLRRQTLYTPQPMDETEMLGDSSLVAPSAATSLRRKTINVNATQGLARSLHANLPELESTKSCDAILTPTNKANMDLLATSSPFNASMSSLVSTPLIQSMSQVHLDIIRRSTTKSIMDEYKSAYDSKRTPAVDNKRRTLNSIAMDIIRQRVENINRSVQNRSISEANNESLLNDAPKDGGEAGVSDEKVALANTAATTTTTTNGSAADTNGVAAEKPKPMRRKLFAPPALFPDAHSDSFAAPTKTDTKKTGAAKAAQKRKRLDESVENKRKSVAAAATSTTSATTNGVAYPSIGRAPKPAPKPVSRRSTLCFVTPPVPSAKPASRPAKPTARTSMMVYTSMHQPQIDFIKEAVRKLGKFELEDNVSANTTHLIALDARRTVNMLRGIARGIWILDYTWITQSIAANKWLPELTYEMKQFSNAVEISRIERQAFGKKYRMDIFRTNDMFYVSSNCLCRNLEELITLCYGRVTQSIDKADYIIDEQFCDEAARTGTIQVHPNWLLDSISAGVIQKQDKYLLKAH